MNASRTGESSWRRRLVGRVQTRLWLFSALLMLLVAVWVIIGRQLMLWVPEFRAPLEQMLEERLQTPLEIGTLRGHMDGLSPVFVLENLTLPPSEEGESLSIRHVALTVDVLPSLLQRDLRLRQLLVRGVNLHVRRTEEGRFRVRGLGPLGSGEGVQPETVRKVLDLFYRQNRLVLDQVNLTLEWPGLPALRTDDLELALVNSGNRHKLSLRLTTPDQKRQLEARLALAGDAYAIEDVNGDFYLRLNGPGWERWATPRWPFPVTPETVDGEVVAWSEVRDGQLESATLRLAMDRIALLDKRDGQRWPVTGAFALARLDARDDGYLLSLSDLNLATPEGEWRAGEVGLWWNGERDEALTWQLQARGFDIRASRNQLLAVPFVLPDLLDGLRRQLTELSPTGQVEDFHATGSRRALETVSGRVSGLGNEARDRLPGFGGLSGWFSGGADSGVARLDAPELSLNMPRLYQHPLRFGITGAFRWEREGEVLGVDSGRIQVENEDARGDALLGLRLAPEQVPELRLLADLDTGDGSAVPAYIPGNRLSEKLAAWLKEAFVDGRVTRGRFLYQGPVKIDPARQQDRTFQMAFDVRNFRLHYLDGWPEITGLSGSVQLDGRRVQGRRLSGELLETRFDGLSFDVPTAAPGKAPDLIVAGHLQGPARDLTRIFSETPLREQLPAELNNWALTAGRLDAHLVMRWPLGQGDSERRLLTNGRLSGATLESRERNLSATEISTPFAFSLRDGLAMPNLSGRLFGESVTGSVTTAAGVTEVSLEGAMTVAALRDWLQADWLAPADGGFGYRAKLALPWEEGALQLQAESTLGGVAVDLPAPLGKSADSEVPSSVQWTAAQPQPELVFRYGERAAGRLFPGDQGIARGHVVLGGRQAGSATESGILVTGNLERLAVSPWVDWVRGQQDGVGAGGEATPLRKLWLKVGALDLYGLTVEQANLTLQPAEQRAWSVQLDSEELAGSLRVPADYHARGEDPLAVTVDRLRLTLPEGDGGELSPLDVPVADVSLKDAVVNGTDFGSWQAQLRPVPDGVRMESLQGNWRKTRFNGRLDWTRSPDNGEQSRYVGSVRSEDMAASLRAWDLDPFLESNKARAVVDLGWPGSPVDTDYTSMTGTASVEIREGRIPETTRGASALRVLGIFNISSISRRLRLDFTDLYKKGLGFDSIGGDFQVEGPVVSTDNLVIKSPSAEFRIRGRMNIQEETLDHYMEVTLPVSSNLYAGCLAGPAACAGIFVFERLWGNELEKMTTLAYRVTGTWSDPKVKETQGLFERKKD